MHTLRDLPDLGVRLTTDGYRKEFWAAYSAIRDGSSWKLERRQHFEEQGDPCRDALRRGDWEESMRLMQDRRKGLQQKSADEAARGSVFHRVRIVEEPLTPYVQWELHSLRLQAEYGTRVRVVPATAPEVVGPSRGGILPEVVILDEQVLYQVLYTDAGVPEGAICFTDPEVIGPWTAYVRDLHALGEDVDSYVERVVAPLPPPPAA